MSGVVVAGGSSGGSWRDEDGGGPEIVTSGARSLTNCITSASDIVCDGLGTTVSGFESPEAGSGKHSRFDFSQRGQAQFLDLLGERGDVGQQLSGWLWDIQSC